MKLICSPIAALCMIITFTHHYARPELIDLTSSQQLAPVLKRNMVIIEFYAPWCGPCYQAAQTLSSLALQYPQLTIIRINSDVFTSIANDYKIRSIPTCIFYENGKRITHIQNANGIVKDSLIGWPGTEQFMLLTKQIFPRLAD